MATSISNRIGSGLRAAAGVVAPGAAGLYDVASRFQRKSKPLSSVKTTPVAPSTGLTGSSATFNALSGGRQQQSAPVAQTPSSYRAPAYQAPTSQQSPTVQPTQIQRTAPTTQFSTPTKGIMTYPGILNSLVGASSASDQQKALVDSLSKTGTENQRIAEEARKLSEGYGKEIAEVGRLGAGAVAGNMSTGTNIVGSGNAAIASQSASQRMSALAAGQQAALEGTGQQLTAQQQMANAQAQALGGANTQQSTQLGGLGTAAGYAQPQVTGYGQTSFDPVTGTFGGGSGNLDPQSQASTLAQQVMNGQMSYDQALQSMGYAGQAGTTFLNNAITGAGGNPLQLQAQGGATQDIIGSQSQQVASYTSALQQGQNLQAQLTDLITTFGLNPNDLNVANVALQKIATNTSDPRYQQLSNYINDIANTYAQILTPSGGSQTDTTRAIATSMLDATASGSSILNTMHSLDEAARAKIAGVPTTPNVGSGGGSGGSFSTTTSDGSNYTFYKGADGKWYSK